MIPVAFVILVLGCGDAGASCEPVRTLPASYTSISACNAAINDALSRQNDVEYPVVAAQCRAKPQLPSVQLASAGR